VPSPHSTTWAHRHHGPFRRLGELLRADGLEAPLVVDIGPGAVCRALAWLFPRHIESEGSWLQRRRRSLARRLDTLLRRLPWTKLQTFEPIELSLPGVACCQVDIGCEPIPYRADVIVCYNVLPVLADGPRAFGHVLAALKPGGLLLIDNRSLRQFAAGPVPLQQIDEKIHRKLHEPPAQRAPQAAHGLDSPDIDGNIAIEP